MQTAKEDCLALAARVLLSLLFLYSGLGKLMAPEATLNYIESAGLPLSVFAYIGAVFVELGLAAALVVGFRTKAAAAVMAVFTLVTALIFHKHFAEKAQLTSFLKNVAICGGLIQVMVTGPGALSLDATFKRPVKRRALND
ncbi:LysR family transcriptional regulator [Pseudomonas syringae]|uniref:LysR family transcriptional regulator n=1 Tax=Pseudomonas syringae TaxID=317 RepID=A0A244EX31_PSESX|nr:DoxX family protein [Pseudomonas syringae]OUM08530.1 LysR family transcriptional regulator [Pseudomonas syringae]